ncbi:MAG TPA: mechanosensitive ion channel domain-containing protein [Polyangiales bacterium]|nr:mechanosensitive ion channel domain-containing protein [Polyangiales bacterium]
MQRKLLTSKRHLLQLALAGALFTPSLGAAAQHDPKAPGPVYAAAEEAMDGVLVKLAPPALRTRGPYRLLWAQWLGMPVIALAGFLIGFTIHRITRRIARSLARRTQATWDDTLIGALNGPLIVTWTLLSTFFLIPLLGLRPSAVATSHHILRSLWMIGLFWGFVRGVDVLSDMLLVVPIGSNGARRALVPVVARMGKLVIFAFALVALLAQLGYSVTSLLAGLGIGGLAVALAAQKTFEHWLGAFAIVIDQPFREGDFVRVDGLQGTIESIGMRSTRLRTLDRTVVSIPNGKLAEMQPETYAPRDRFRMLCELRLVYGTTADQVREILREVRHVLDEHPKIWPDGTSVILRELGASALVIEAIGFFTTADNNEFNAVRQDVLLQFMHIVEAAGTQLALPGQRVELVGQPAQPVAASDISALSAPGSSRRA